MAEALKLAAEKVRCGLGTELERQRSEHGTGTGIADGGGIVVWARCGSRNGLRGLIERRRKRTARARRSELVTASWTAATWVDDGGRTGRRARGWVDGAA